MGGGSRFPYPKWVWSWYGGWWAQPANAKSNAAIAAGICATAVAVTWTISANKETRHRYPSGWIPSMLWSRDFHDPAFVAMWKEQLAKEGREWIEPIPDWWPFKKQ